MSLGSAFKSLFGFSSQAQRGNEPSIPAARALPSVSERRIHARHNVRERVRFYLGTYPVSATLVDISMGGVRVSTKHPREVGSEIILEIDHNGRSSTVPVKIIWDRFLDGSFESGGRFVDLRDDEKTHLQDYIDHLNASLN